jgi:hypothetical protein
MGFRFHKRIKIVPGLWYNVGKRGGSLSVGGKGVTWNSKRGTTFSVRGTGVSYNVPNSRKGKAAPPAAPLAMGCMIWIFIGIAVLASCHPGVH